MSVKLDFPGAKLMNEEPAPATPAVPRSRKRFFIFAAVLFSLATAGSLYVALLPKEPSYNGKPLSFWLKQFNESSGLNSKDPKAIESDQALRQIGTNAIPTLLRMVRAKDSAVKTKLIDLLDRQHYVDIHLSDYVEQNALAEVGFLCLRDLGTSAIPALIEICTNSPSESSKVTANSVLIMLYPASAAKNPYWIPLEHRSEWYYRAATVKLQQEDNSNAFTALSEAIKLNPTNVPAYMFRSSLEIDLKEFAAALADAKKAVELDTNEETISTLALCKFSLKDFKGAEAEFTTVVKLDTNNASALNYRGLARANLRNLDGAMADLNQAIKIWPNDASAYRNRSLVENMQREYESALADVSKSIDLDNKDPYTFAARGRIRNSLKDFDAARADFDKAIDMKAEDPGIYVSRAAAEVYLDDFEKANADLETAMRLGPENAACCVVRGFLKAKRADEEGSLADFERAVELSPQTPETYAMLGYFQYKASRWTPALENCRKALQLHKLGDRSDLVAYIWLIRAQTGQEKGANGELESYLRMPEGAKNNEWAASIARFFSGDLAESDFLSQATTTAIRPSAVKGQVCESLYYAGMKRKLAGDKQGAVEFFQKCLDTKNDNNLGYMNAGVEMRTLKKTD